MLKVNRTQQVIKAILEDDFDIEDVDYPSSEQNLIDYLTTSGFGGPPEAVSNNHFERKIEMFGKGYTLKVFKSGPGDSMWIVRLFDSSAVGKVTHMGYAEETLEYIQQYMQYVRYTNTGGR